MAWLVIATRVLIFLAGWLAVGTLGEVANHPPPSTDNRFLDLPARWDTGWYVGVGSGGYRWDGRMGRFENIAFFPAYPLSLRLAATVSGAADSAVAWNWTGVVWSTVLFLGATWYLVRLSCELGYASYAAWSICFAATYPFGIYFSLPYTESLFLLGCVAACVHFLRAEFAAALLAGILVGLTRPNGALLSLALALLWLQVEIWPRLTLWRRHAVRLGLGATAVLGPALGVALYSTFVHSLTGDALAWASAQDGWGRLVQNPVSALTSVGLRVLASPIEMATQFPADLLNGLFGMAALTLAYPIGRRLGWGFGAFVASGVVLPLTVGGLASLGRYTSVLFPLFVYFAVAIPPSLRPWAAGSLMALQLVVAALFFTWRPIY